MINMIIVEVNTPALRREFITFPKHLYRGDPFWVCPLDTEVEAVFDAARNYVFRHGEASRWILTGDDGKTIGDKRATGFAIDAAVLRQFQRSNAFADRREILVERWHGDVQVVARKAAADIEGSQRDTRLLDCLGAALERGFVGARVQALRSDVKRQRRFGARGYDGTQ